MVQLARSGSILPESATGEAAVKLEVEDSLEEEHGPFNKRSRTSSPFQQDWNAGASPSPPILYNPLDEPSPLGLRLKKSPSLLDLIQMTLCQGNAPSEKCEIVKLGDSKDSKNVAPSGDKLKASNFPATLLRVGNWDYASRHEGDLVAKCYFAKHKLVWEVLEGGLKSKIEIQWSDIMGLKASLPDEGLGTLNVVLARQPLFFRETNPQPRKHTLWQATADFTGGQASIHRIHFLQFTQGVLNKHFEKLIQCDMRLNFLSQQPDIILGSPYFEPRPSVVDSMHDIRCCTLNKLAACNRPASKLVESRSPVAGSGTSVESIREDTCSPSSVMDTHAIEGSGSVEAEPEVARDWKQADHAVRPAMSMSEIMNRIGHRISTQLPSVNFQPSATETPECHKVLQNIAHHLLSDTQLTAASDEKLLMSRVDSLCCLLQRDQPTFQDVLPGSEANDEEVSSRGSDQPTITRKDSFGELLMNLPRIASLPKFLFNISEDGENDDR